MHIHKVLILKDTLAATHSLSAYTAYTIYCIYIVCAHKDLPTHSFNGENGLSCVNNYSKLCTTCSSCCFMRCKQVNVFRRDVVVVATLCPYNNVYRQKYTHTERLYSKTNDLRVKQSQFKSMAVEAVRTTYI